MIKAPKQESTYDIVPAGNHVARIYRILHLGTAPDTYMGEEKMINKIMIGWELSNEKKVFRADKGEELYVISAEYTLSMNEKSNLRKLIEGMLGVVLNEGEAEAFDVLSLVDETCLLNVIHKTASTSGREYAMVKGASPIPKGMFVPPPYNPVQKLDYEDWNTDLFNSLPPFIREKITNTIEYKKLMKSEPDFSKIPF